MRANVLAAAVVLAGTAAILLAAEYPDFTEMMKAAGKATGALQKLDKRTGPQAVDNAEDLGGIYEQMIAFWRQRKDDKAVQLSEQGKAAAVVLATAAHAGDEAKAEQAFKALTETCHSCHTTNREKLPDGSYRIK